MYIRCICRYFTICCNEYFIVKKVIIIILLDDFNSHSCPVRVCLKKTIFFKGILWTPWNIHNFCIISKNILQSFSTIWFAVVAYKYQNILSGSFILHWNTLETVISFIHIQIDKLVCTQYWTQYVEHEKWNSKELNDKL